MKEKAWMSSHKNIEQQVLSSLLIPLKHPALILNANAVVLECNVIITELFRIPHDVFLQRNLFELCKTYSLPTPILTLEESQVHQTTLYTKTFRWSVSPIQLAEQTLFFVIGFDITAFVNASTQEKYINTSIIDLVPNHYIFWKDKNSVYLGCNAALASKLGLSCSADIVGKTDYDLPTTTSQSDAYRADDRLVMESKQAKLNIEEQQTLENGVTRVLSTSKTPLFDEEGNVYGVLAIYSDITERKNMELSLEKAKNQAEAANFAKTDFIVNMSHDIRTPLSGIIGISKLLGDSTENTRDKQYAQWIYESSQQLLELLNSILDIISTGNIKKNEVIEETFDLYQCIQGIEQLERPTIKQRGLEFFTEIDANVPRFIISDRTKLHRVLLNLLGNAIKFTHTGHVKIKIERLTKKHSKVLLKFSVIDTGIGIPEASQNKVFDRFYRGSRSSKGTYKGHGVGLHIAQEFIRLLGGEIALSSQPDVGTVVTFTLPLKGECVQCLESLENNNPTIKKHLEIKLPTLEPSTTHSPQVLLVEDNVISLHLIEALMTQAGLDYTSAITGEMALKLATSNHYDLIITDIGLPGISGYELTRAIRQWEQEFNHAPTPIIGLTAHAIHEVKNECLQSGMYNMLAKPINLKTIQQLMKEYIPNFQPLTSTQELDTYPLLDISRGIVNLGNESYLKDMLERMLSSELPNTEKELQQAYQEHNWTHVEKLAHRLKGGAIYCGTLKLQHACQILEQCRKQERHESLDTMYQQLQQVLEETKQSIDAWLKKTQKL